MDKGRKSFLDRINRINGIENYHKDQGDHDEKFKMGFLDSSNLSVQFPQVYSKLRLSVTCENCPGMLAHLQKAPKEWKPGNWNGVCSKYICPPRLRLCPNAACAAIESQKTKCHSQKA